MPNKIAWCDKTWNPIVVSADGWTGELCFVPNKLDEPLKWRKPQRIFVCSMGDLFHDKVKLEWLCEIARSINQSPQHTYLITTKRAERMQDQMRIHYSQYCVRPIPNLHLGISVSIQKDLDDNIQYLLDTPAAVRWISLEPMLGPIDNIFREKVFKTVGKGVSGRTHYAPRKIDWVVCGCESGPGRRPMKEEWALDVAQQCSVAGVPFFMKQMEIDGRVTGEMSKFPPGLQRREYPR